MEQSGFVLDTNPTSLDDDESSDSEVDETEKSISLVRHFKLPSQQGSTNLSSTTESVWKDDDDAALDPEKVAARRANFISAFGDAPSYLNTPADEDDNVVQAVKVLSHSSDQLQFKQLADANKESPSRRRLTAVEFHPSNPILMTASTDQRLCLFTTDADRVIQDRLHSHTLDNFPIMCAQFSSDATQIHMTSKYSTFNTFDVTTQTVTRSPKLLGVDPSVRLSKLQVLGHHLIAFIGPCGILYLVDERSKNMIRSLYGGAGTQIRAVSKYLSGKLLTAGNQGSMCLFSIGEGRLINEWSDEGSLSTLSLAVSADQSLVACGSSSGVVNLYCDWSGPSKPMHTLMNIRTPVDILRFNSVGDQLLFASHEEPGAVRICHIPSFRVDSNFPPRNSVSAIHAADYSPGSGLLCLGQHTGRAALFRLPNYSVY